MAGATRGTGYRVLMPLRRILISSGLGAAAEATFPRMGADLKASLAFPSFYDNFADGAVTNSELAEQITNASQRFTH